MTSFMEFVNIPSYKCQNHTLEFENATYIYCNRDLTFHIKNFVTEMADLKKSHIYLDFFFFF